MITDNWWIEQIDHRVSAAIIFSFLLLLLNGGKKRSLFVLRAGVSVLVMMIAGFAVRWCTDVIFTETWLRALGYALQIVVLYHLFLGAYRWCYRVRMVDVVFISMLALTIYKIAWNAFKTGSSLLQVNSLSPFWSRYSVVGALFSYFVYFILCILCVVIYRKTVQDAALHTTTVNLVVLSVIIVSCQMLLEFCGHMFTGEQQAEFIYYLCALLYTIINFAALVMIALLDSFRHENSTMRDFIDNKMRYYEMSHDGIVALQTKCHDLKHQINAIRSTAGKNSFDQYLTELEESINSYSTVVECGHSTIDVVLTEKNILCTSANVKFSYMIDGAIFSFLTDREIYSLFGNALDNALEATAKVPDASRRMITLKSNERGGFVVLLVENTYEGELNIGDDLPRTTKKETGHGFGLRSIQRLAEKHGGSMSVRAENGVFRLSIFMCPDAEAE